mgnify:CR=1 FL=1
MRIGVDLGGTKIEAVALDDNGDELARHRVATPAGDYPATMSAIAELVRLLERETGRTGTVGIGMPGAVSPQTGLIKNANSTCLIGQRPAADLQGLLGREIRLANDADCFALSEATDGAAVGAHSVFGVILGTGVGGGLVWQGQLLTGPNAIAGEWGHNPLPWPMADELPGPACYCGKHGCIEAFLSGPAVMTEYDRTSPHKVGSPSDIPDDAFWRRYEDRLARALAGVINIFDPAVIVLGGGLSNIDRLYQNVPAILPEYVFGGETTTRLAKAAYGDSSGVRGAAWLWPSSREFQNS